MNRLGLAQYLVSPVNPLTARVAVNRIWAQIFGTAIVETGEDFDLQSAPSSTRSTPTALRLALARPPMEKQVQTLLCLYKEEMAYYRGDPAAAKRLATEPLSPMPEGEDAAEQATF